MNIIKFFCHFIDNKYITIISDITIMQLLQNFILYDFEKKLKRVF